MTAQVADTKRLRVLVIDDEKNIRTTLSMCIEGMGCLVTAVGSAEAALTAMTLQTHDMAFLDLRLGNTSGLELLPQLIAENPAISVVVITAYATIDTAVDAIRRGAFNYLPKPFSPPQIRQMVDLVIERRTMELQKADLEQRLAQEVPDTDLETASPRMRSTLEIVERAAGSDASVLLRGQNGTGKGILARVLHARSARRDHPFVVVNCPTLSEDLLASELFGHTRGAFTGAVKDQAGRVEAAQGGTLFLDEIGEISPGLQAKLLRFLQDRQFERIGENRTRTADVRVVTATNRDLDADVKAGRFREDLYYRLNVIEIQVPALRDRQEDILPMARRFLSFFSMAAQRPPVTLSRAAEEALLAYPWPGNVRELRNVMERAVILWSASIIEPQALPERIVTRGEKGPRVGGDFPLDEVEREHIQRVVARASTLEEAARILRIEPSTLWRKRKRWEAC